MENYNDEKLLEDYSQMAKAYASSLKNKGFVFVRLEEEEQYLLTSEIMLIFSKLFAVFDTLKDFLSCDVIKALTAKNCEDFENKFHVSCHKNLLYVDEPSSCVFTLISLENLLTTKLMILSVKSGEFEFCHDIISSRAYVYATSFPLDAFITKK